MTYTYTIHFLDLLGVPHTHTLESVGLAEAVDTFIETYCPVASIESVVKHEVVPAKNRESRSA